MTADLRAVAVAAHADQRPSARKRGRNPRYPYVPVVEYPEGRLTHTDQIRGYAFATRDEAVAHAAALIAARIDSLAERLADPAHRALREHHGLPRDLHAVDVPRTNG